MKNYTVIFIIALLLWMCGSSYWYVNNIKGISFKDSTNISVTKSTIEKDTSALKITETVPVTEKLTPVKESEPLLIIDNKVVYFEFGKDILAIDDELDNYINELKQYMSQDEKRTVSLVGHTDDVGNENENTALGLRRAEFIKEKLVAKGIEAKYIKTTSKGESDLITTSKTEKDRSMERRVEIVIK